MRISDWSSDVCSSDLVVAVSPIGAIPDPGRAVAVARLAVDDAGIAGSHARLTHKADAAVGPNQALDVFRAHIVPDDVGQIARGTELGNEDVLDLRSRIALAQQRSEEHTTEHK